MFKRVTKQKLLTASLFCSIPILILVFKAIGKVYISNAMSLRRDTDFWEVLPPDFGFVNGVTHLFIWDTAYFGGEIVPFLFYTLTFIAIFVVFSIAIHRLFTIHQAKEHSIE